MQIDRSLITQSCTRTKAKAVYHWMHAKVAATSPERFDLKQSVWSKPCSAWRCLFRSCVFSENSCHSDLHVTPHMGSSVRHVTLPCEGHTKRSEQNYRPRDKVISVHLSSIFWIFNIELICTVTRPRSIWGNLNLFSFAAEKDVLPLSWSTFQTEETQMADHKVRFPQCV